MEVLRNYFEGYPNLGQGSTLRTDSVTNHSVWNHPCKNQLRSILGYLILLSESYSSFQHESGRTPAPLSKRIRIDSVCLLNWFAGRTRLFFSIQKGGLPNKIHMPVKVVLE